MLTEQSLRPADQTWGRDRIYVLLSDRGSGKYRPVGGSPFSVPPGDGPRRHFTFSVARALAVLAAGESITVTVLSFFIGTDLPYAQRQFRPPHDSREPICRAEDLPLAGRADFPMCPIDSTTQLNLLADHEGRPELCRRSIHHGRLPKAHTNRSRGSIPVPCNPNGSDAIYVVRIDGIQGRCDPTGHIRA